MDIHLNDEKMRERAWNDINTHNAQYIDIALSENENMGK
jgi:hypothetical protein